MKAFHVACVVSALAATASGANINLSPSSPAKLLHESSPLSHRRSVRGPFPRILRRAQALKLKYRGEKRSLVRRQLENQLSTLTQRLSNEDANFDTVTSRRVIQSGIPGFVEIAIPDPTAGVARTVSGLAYTLHPDNGALELGTSASHSTQFFLSPLKHIDGSSLYRLKAPILDSSDFKNVEHCATFATSPAGPLSMKKCSDIQGFSQRFSYDPVSGEIQPVYPSSPSPTPSSPPKSNSNDHEKVPVTTKMKKRQINEASTTAESGSSTSGRKLQRTLSTPPQSSAVLYFIPAKKAN